MQKQTITLNNGVEMPLVGLGAYKLDPAEICEEAVLSALQAGYRLIDTATIYGNEEAVGNAIKKSGIPREELFIETKLWVSSISAEKAEAAFNESLRKLGVDYIDLYLLHQPFNDYIGAWKVLEKLYKQGKIRAIGVSNFHPDHLTNLIEFTEIVPAVNQIEIHPFLQREEMVKFNQELGVTVQSWASFARGANDIFNHPILTKLAAKHRKTPSQIILRWLVQRDIAVIPKSATPSRIAENFNIFDFSLDAEDMEFLRHMNQDLSFFEDQKDPAFIRKMAAKICY